jgi:hypothetical protein
VMCFVVLIPFFGFRELARVIGQSKMRALIFGNGAGEVTSSAL